MQLELFSCNDLLRFNRNKYEFIPTLKDISLDVEEEIPIKNLSVENIRVDSSRFQYKIMSDRAGSTGSLSDIKKWTPEFAGLCLVWVDPSDQNIYIVNGHNRLALARKLNIPKILCRFINATTANEARIIGAMANIAEGRGTVLDAAKIFRENQLNRHDLIDYGIKLTDRLADDGLAIANLDVSLYDQALTGELEHDLAVACGRLKNLADQHTLKRLALRENRKLSKVILAELTETVLSCGSDSNLDLFGLLEVDSAVPLERARLISYVKSRLKTEELLFSKVSRLKNKKILETKGNKIDQSSSTVYASKLDKVLTLFEQFKNLAGPISTSLTESAKNIVRAKSEKEKESIRDGCYQYCFFNLDVDALDLICA